MAVQHPSDEHIRAMLREGHFGEGGELPAADPLTPTQMLLEIERIKPYDRNPRRERNPLYDEIKESIRAQGGLTTPLTITRRPGEDLFMVEAGGNTRLQILHELWEETHDGRFHRVHCLFRPWVGESHVLTAHLIENDKRGALAFIDKALGVRALRDLLQAERNEPLTQRELGETLRERGYGLDQSVISRMDYAVDVLLPLIPEALRAGLGPTPIRRIRRLESACQAFWNDRGQAPQAFMALFADVLTAHDRPAWDLESAQRALETRLSEHLELPRRHVRLELDARLARGTEDPPFSAPLDPSPPVGEPRAGSATHQAPSGPEEHSRLNIAAFLPDDAPVHDDLRQDASPAIVPVSAPAAGRDTTPAEYAAPPYNGPADPKSLRSRGYVLALKIAQRHDLADCVIPAGQLGMGFWVDLPRDAIIPVAGQADALDQLFRQWVWWLLLSLSEESVHPERIEQAPDDLLLRTLILEHNDAKALALVGEPDWKAIGYELTGNPSVPEETIDDLLALMRTCRRLRQTAGDGDDAALWRSGK